MSKMMDAVNRAANDRNDRNVSRDAQHVTEAIVTWKANGAISNTPKPAPKVISGGISAVVIGAPAVTQFDEALARCEAQVRECDQQIAQYTERLTAARWSREVHAKRLAELKACQAVSESLRTAHEELAQHEQRGRALRHAADHLEQQLRETIARTGGFSR